MTVYRVNPSGAHVVSRDLTIVGASRDAAHLNKLTSLISTAFLAALSACATTNPSTQPKANQVGDALFDTISALDTAVFDSFNDCSSLGQLEKHASYSPRGVEFYHDTGGVTWTRQDMIANTEKYVCGKFRRELVSGSLKVFPLKDFGSIEQGVHRFCQFKTGDCEGMADFLIVWRNQGDTWQITRVLSYGHRPNE